MDDFSTKLLDREELMRIGAECGGTFTDVVLTSETGSVIGYTKVLSTPHDPSDAVISGVKELVANTDHGHMDMLHGSTVATNALIERKGGKVGLITTRGFEDVLYIQRMDRSTMYDLSWVSPEPLLPRDMIVGVKERISSRGEVRTQISCDEVDQAIRELLSRGAETIAVSLLHSYANPVHEQLVENRIREIAPQAEVSLSSFVAREFREFERTNTVTVDAFLKPRIRRYISKLASDSAELGVQSLQVMQSNGGVVPAHAAAALPVSMLRSGPAAGVAAATSIAREMGRTNVVTLDMGGTSTDVSVVNDYSPMMATELEDLGLPVKVPLVDIVAVGAGGGSKVYTDRGGLLTVGPESVGSDPGPICYGRGGTELTVSDINLAKGLLHERAFLGGSLSLDRKKVEQQVSRAANELGISPEAFIENSYRLANVNMANAIRIATTERGVDPRQYSLIAYGGAGPLHAAKVAEEIGIGEVIVPHLAGVSSAVGLLVADFRREFSQTWFVDSSEAETRLNEVGSELRGRAVKELARLGVDIDDLVFDFTADMRYKGQGFELSVEVPNLDVTLGEMAHRFNNLHAERYGHADWDRPVQMVTLRVVAKSFASVASADFSTLTENSFSLDITTDVLEGTERSSTRIVSRNELPKHEDLKGPLIVADPTSTTFIPSGWSANVSENLTLTIRSNEL